MGEFEEEWWSDKATKEVQDVILIGLKYKEAYEKLLWQKNILISCLCSNKTKVISIDDEEGQTRYHVLVAPLDSDDDQRPAIWGIDDGELVEGYACYSPYSAVQWMLTEMKKLEDENEG